MHPGASKGLDDPGGDSSEPTDSAAETGNEPGGTQPAGVLIARYTSLRIPVGGLVIRAQPDGTMKMDPVVVEVSLETWPHWLGIAFDHLKVAKNAQTALVEAQASTDDPARNQALQDEFQASMQAICAAAFTLDALYGSLIDLAPPPDATKDAWTKNGTSRAGRILHMVHQVARLTNPQGKALRTGLKGVFEFRNWAVHPPKDFRRPLLHPDLQVGVDWRFAVYRYENAGNAVSLAVEVLMRTFEQPRNDDAIQKWATQQAQILQSLLTEREITYTDASSASHAEPS